MLVVAGGPADRRVELLQAALAGLGRPPARVVAYADLLDGAVRLDDLVRPGDTVRIESPGKDSALERRLIAAAAEPEPGFDHYPPAALADLPVERGRILSSRQWYRGFAAALGRIAEQLALAPPHRLMNHPAEIAVMFDKPACHARLGAAGVAVPPALDPVGSYAELVEAVRAAGMRRVFIKPAHGSSASGVVAYEWQAGRQQATTTVEMVGDDGQQPRLYNSRRVRTYRDPAAIARLIDELCRQRVHVERWLPKAGIAGHVFDLRVVVIAGQARHAVARMSRTPITNLHLLNPRGDLGAVRELLGPAAWAAALRTCEDAAACFPKSLYAGIDLLIGRDLRSRAVLEVNSFGDLLPGVLCAGRDTYAAEILAMEEMLCSTPAP